MNIKNILDEARRVEAPKKTDDTAKKQALRAPGDVGKVDRLTQMDKDKKGPALRPVAGAPRGAFTLKKRNVSAPGQYVDRVADEAGEPRQAPQADEISYSQQGRKLKKKYKPGMDRINRQTRGWMTPSKMQNLLR